MAGGTIRVTSDALALAAVRISTSADAVERALAKLSQAAGEEPSFGGEQAGGAFAGTCVRARSALGEIQSTSQQLSTNTAAAAEGYLVTDQGVIPGGFAKHAELGGRW